jgi:hypothetical protein
MPGLSPAIRDFLNRQYDKTPSGNNPPMRIAACFFSVLATIAWGSPLAVLIYGFLDNGYRASQESFWLASNVVAIVLLIVVPTVCGGISAVGLYRLLRKARRDDAFGIAVGLFIGFFFYIIAAFLVMVGLFPDAAYP